VDGRSIVPLLGSSPPPASDWRQDFLVEIYPLTEEDEIRAVRTRDWLYAEYLSGARELYDLRADPYQLESLHGSARPELLLQLSARLWELASCAADTCEHVGR